MIGNIKSAATVATLGCLLSINSIQIHAFVTFSNNKLQSGTMHHQHSINKHVVPSSSPFLLGHTKKMMNAIPDLTKQNLNQIQMKMSPIDNNEGDSPYDSTTTTTSSSDQMTIDEDTINGLSSKLTNGLSSTTTHNSQSKFQSVLEEVGLSGQIASLKDLQSNRLVSRNGVFCNRELKLNGIRAIGFDMDYTIAQYQQPAFDKLAFDGAKKKLVHDFGYPEELLDVEYDHTFWIRGLVIDTTRGNFLKIDRHKYVKLAYHGYTPISSRTRKDIYSRFFNQVPSFSEKQYVNMDTLFQFVDASLFATLIEMKDDGEHDTLDFKTYEEIYKDIRQCVDLCHRDGVIKDEVARNPEKYIVLDDGLVPMLKKFREDGIRVFLLTNSYWTYTSDAMNYLYHQKNVDKETKLRNEWVDLFDLVIVGSCKPAFLVDPYLNLFRVNPRDGSLLNTDGTFEIKALGENGAQKFLEQGKIFQGGNWQHLTAMLETEAGEEIMYVGDHLYADVLRSKRTLGWRSVFIMPELPEEMETFYEQRPIHLQIKKLRSLRDELSLYTDMILRSSDAKDPKMQEKLRVIEEDDRKVTDALKGLTHKYHAAFHPIWGMMFAAGYQDSRLAYFVTNYACLYTGKATNLGLASTTRSFRTSGEDLPHDKLLIDDMTILLDED